MSLKLFLDRLHDAGLDLTPESVLDALWLASGPWDLAEEPPRPVPKTRKSAAPAPSPATAPSSPAQPAPTTTTPPPRTEAPPSTTDPVVETRDQRLYPDALPSSVDRTLPAAPLRLPAARTLAHRLELTRALRPLRTRYPSRAVNELDEEATAELTAELQAVTPGAIFPVERPRPERWYEAHLVLEDDPAIEVWAAPLREFSRTLRDSGAFRVVRIWRLRLNREKPSDLRKAFLETPAGARAGLGQLGGGDRRLVLFASHGVSTHWRDSLYAQLLSHWTDGSLALLHVQRRERWRQTRLGEPNGVGHADQTGAPSRSLRAERIWWRQAPDPSAPTTVRLPVTRLEPGPLGRWARMQMGRGSNNPTFLLNRKTSGSMAAQTAGLDDEELERRLDALREASPDAYQLALALTAAPFTLPVARVIQETVLGGATDHHLLGDLLLSGLVVSRGSSAARVDEHTPFEIAPLARSYLMRAWRPSDAERVARELELRVGQHLSKTAFRDFSFEALRLDPAGRAALPAWAKPFADMGEELLKAAEPAKVVFDPEAFLKGLSTQQIGRLARLAKLDGHLSQQPVRRDVWGWLLGSGALVSEAEGDWSLHPALLEPLRARHAEHPLLGARILWVDDQPRNNIGLPARFRKLGAEAVVEVRSTEAALEQSELETFDVIISDMARGRRPRAGFELIESLVRRGLEAPVVIFAGRFPRDEHDSAQLRNAGGYSSTNDPDGLEKDLAQALTDWLLGWTPQRQKSQEPELRRARARLMGALRSRYTQRSRSADPLTRERARLVYLIANRPADLTAAPAPGTSEPPAQPSSRHPGRDPAQPEPEATDPRTRSAGGEERWPGQPPDGDEEQRDDEAAAQAEAAAEAEAEAAALPSSAERRGMRSAPKRRGFATDAPPGADDFEEGQDATVFSPEERSRMRAVILAAPFAYTVTGDPMPLGEFERSSAVELRTWLESPYAGAGLRPDQIWHNLVDTPQDYAGIERSIVDFVRAADARTLILHVSGLIARANDDGPLMQLPGRRGAAEDISVRDLVKAARASAKVEQVLCVVTGRRAKEASLVRAVRRVVAPILSLPAGLGSYLELVDLLDGGQPLRGVVRVLEETVNAAAAKGRERLTAEHIAREVRRERSVAVHREGKFVLQLNARAWRDPLDSSSFR